MEFDIDRVYTAKDADELKPGAVVVPGDNMEELKHNIVNGLKCELCYIRDEKYSFRFVVSTTEASDISSGYALCYLVESEHEQAWKQFKIGDIVMYNNIVCVVASIDFNAANDSHIKLSYGGWLNESECATIKKVTDAELEELYAGQK